MNKKLKKILATVSAVAMCATSMTAMTSGALYILNTHNITPYTVSFTSDGLKYGVWQEMNDYFNNDNWKFFISEDGSSNVFLLDGNITLWYFGGYYLKSEEEITDFKQYLTNSNIEYTESSWVDGNVIKIVRSIDIGDGEYESLYTDDEYFQLIKEIKEDTGLVQIMMSPATATTIEVSDVENVLPEPTLTGDSNEDGEVSIADAILIMQSLVNPDEYSLTPQGIANADMNGDGITTLDALSIQEMLVKK